MSFENYRGSQRGWTSSDDRNQHRAPHAATEMMVVEQLFRSRPRRRASPCLAEGFSLTASAGDRI
jgi:hypothetical protein